ncbi:MAG: right-handed parallel beta-helix repeat-containing protein, partial [Bacteroidales bacterium]|nr:right-handed parallel beta-helix repeat-containing protein [Bacteroidales bacterium]
AADNCKNINIVPLDTIPNVISGNDNGGISLWDTCTNSLIAGNIIGLNRTKTEAVGGNNGAGITFLRCDSITIVENWIGGNTTGIGIWECSDFFIAGNRIGTDPEWTNDLMNSGDGIEIGHESKRNMIMGNFIGNNSRDGIRITGIKAMYNTISENSISMNESEGINLVDGANSGIAAPKITNLLENEIFGTASPLSIIEIYTDNDDEGRIIQDVVLSDSAGNWGWAGTIEGPFDSIRVTATDTMGNTSEFGKYVPEEEPSSIEKTRQPIPFTLSQNYPGYHSEIHISFDLPAYTDVSLDVYNLSGVKVYGISKGKLQTGHHSLSWNTSQHTAGIYLIRMQTYRGALTKKCVVIK